MTRTGITADHGPDRATDLPSWGSGCAPICARDTLSSDGTRETPVRSQRCKQDNRPGQPGRQRPGRIPETCAVRLITQRRLVTSRRASTWPERGATASRKPANGALREAREYAAAPLAAQIARRTAPEALIALEFRGHPFHDSFHAWLATAWPARLNFPILAARPPSMHTLPLGPCRPSAYHLGAKPSAPVWDQTCLKIVKRGVIILYPYPCSITSRSVVCSVTSSDLATRSR